MADVVGETFCIFRQPLIKTLCMSQRPNHMLPLEGCQKGKKKYTKLLKAALLIFNLRWSEGAFAGTKPSLVTKLCEFNTWGRYANCLTCAVNFHSQAQPGR